MSNIYCGLSSAFVFSMSLIRAHSLVLEIATLTSLLLQARWARPQTSPAATQPASDVRPRLNQVSREEFPRCSSNSFRYAYSYMIFLFSFIIFKSFTFSPAFKQSLFESQLEDYASAMQRVYWLYITMSSLFLYPNSLAFFTEIWWRHYYSLGIL